MPLVTDKPNTYMGAAPDQHKKEPVAINTEKQKSISFKQTPCTLDDGHFDRNI
jgi:hypothetical protein